MSTGDWLFVLIVGGGSLTCWIGSIAREVIGNRRMVAEYVGFTRSQMPAHFVVPNGQRKRHPYEVGGQWRLEGSDFATVDRELAVWVASELDRVDPLLR